MADLIYPASSNAQAIALNISNANQFFTVLQGGIEDFIPTYEGNGEIPSVAKALNEAAAYKVPLPWETTGEATDLLQPYEYLGNIYVPLTTPAPFSTAPDNAFWRLYSEKTAQILIENVTFTGDGTTTDFGLPTAVVEDPSAYFVTVDGVTQRPTIDYTVDVGTDTLSFTEAPPSTSADNISVTILGALRGALAEEIYETTADGLANTSDGQFFNVVNTTDPEAFIDLYKNNAGAALLIDTYPNSVAYTNLANAVAYKADLADNSVGNGSDLVAHTGTSNTVTEALDTVIEALDTVIEAPYKIAVVGDSLSTENALAEHAWPSLLEKYINNSGGLCRVVNYSRNSFTFREASTDPNPFDGRTARDAIIQEKPDLIITAFGTVDVIANENESSLTELKADASGFVAAIKAELPDTKIVHAQMVNYDRVNGNLNSLANKDVLPYFMKKRTTGILADSFCSEILDDTIDASIQSNFVDGQEWYEYIRDLPEVEALIDVDYWKIARMGLMGPDGLHPKTFGKLLQCGYVIKSITDAEVDPFFAKLRKKNYDAWYDPDVLIDGIINKTSNWDFQYLGTSGQDHGVNLNSLYKDVAPTVWYLPYKTSVSIPRTQVDAGQPFSLSIFNGPPNQEVYPSVDGSAFDTNDPSVELKINGCGSVTLIDPVPSGTYEFRYKCGPEIYGPYSLTFVAGGGGTPTDAYTEAESDALFVKQSQNLSDLDSVSSARTNLSVYSKSESDSAYLQKIDNLNSLSSKAASRSNLGVNQTGPLNPSFETGWTNEGVDYKDAKYYKDHNNRVHLEGCIKRTSGTETVAFYLPVGYRPADSVGFCHPLQGSPSVMLVYFDGRVDISGYTTNNDLAFIDGISFMAS